MKPDERPVKVVSASGIELILDDGRVILDCCGGAAVACLGNGHRQVIDAIKTQAEICAYAYNVNYTTSPAEELARLLCTSSDGAFDKVGYLSGGSEAMEGALKLGRQYFLEIGQPERVKFISRELSYHGNTLGSLAVSGSPSRRAGYGPLFAENFERVSPAFPFRFKDEEMTEEAYVEELKAELESTFERLGGNSVIGFVAETVVGATCGCVSPPKGYFPAIKSVCEKYGALLILDEVMCGMGRMGATHAWQIYGEGVRPDIQAIAKGLGGGYQPIGAILISPKLSSALQTGSGRWLHGHTYQAHPISCAAALAVQRVVQEEGFLDQVREKGVLLSTWLKTAIDANDHVRQHVGDIRGRGLFWAIEFVEDRSKSGKKPFPADLSPRFSERVTKIAFEEHMIGLLGVNGVADLEGQTGDCVLLAPSFLITHQELNTLVVGFVASVEKALKNLLMIGQPDGFSKHT
ncbi:hypothetical protein CROQUDRAFT_41810 [Cronartium quercuum f. sp. fusiforme G11]|uniref:Aminotransferase n=1 Tax=Cronartium quercuum f. sp. fusiforme G11 TaxID=708437 RepID=A0A9P6TEV2_9BASI|nr:hypothetical protein CROQUDRAFT_41810 [Cronartium quercuum f. sp. fusiforme G11]